MKRFNTTLGLVALLGVGCASTNVPQTRVVSVETAVHSARVSGAPTVASANEQLKKAEDELNQAKTIINNKGDAREAEALLTRAESDAALAAALTREAQAKGKEAPAPAEGKPHPDSQSQPDSNQQPDSKSPPDSNQQPEPNR